MTYSDGSAGCGMVLISVVSKVIIVQIVVPSDSIVVHSLNDLAVNYNH